MILKNTRLIMQEFSQKTREALNYYVYCLQDPRSNHIFYVGKGKDNRVFEHVKWLLKDAKESDKLIQIKKIIASGDEVKHYIIRHNLTEIEALKVEASIIDVLKYDEFWLWVDLTNIVSGHFSLEWIEKTENIESIYAAEPLDPQKIKHKLLVININKTYLEEESIYEATRKRWVVGPERANKVDYIISEYRWVTRAIFKTTKPWVKSPFHIKTRRWFEGIEVVDKEILDLYLHKTIEKKRGTANPIKYFYPTNI